MKPVYLTFLLFIFTSCFNRKEKIEPIKPSASFSFELGKNGEVKFINKSQNAKNYQWDFGDGKLSMDESPIHIFKENKNYTIKLIAISIDNLTSEFKSDVIINSILPIIDFSFGFLNNGTVEFKNKSINLNSFEWTFGDFSPNGFSKDTVHTYLENKKYTVQLLGKDESGKAYQKDTIITITNRNVPIDNFKYNCDNNIFGLNTNFKEFCSRYSEYGSVILSKHKLGRQFDFWYTFAEDRNSSFSNYEFSFVTSAIINDVGTYEFTPKQSKERIFEANSAWIEVHYDRQKQIPWAFTFITPQKIKLNISNVTEEFISGSVEIFIDNQLKFNGNFKNLQVKK